MMPISAPVVVDDADAAEMPLGRHHQQHVRIDASSLDQRHLARRYA